MTLQQNAKNILKWTAVSLFVAWLFFALGAHYVAQKPFDPAMLATGIQWPSFTFSGRAVGRSLLDVAVAAWLALAGLGSGLWFWRWLGLESDSRLEQGLFAIGLGLSAPGLVVLVLGLAGWLTRPFLVTITLLFSAAAVPALIPYLRHIQLRLPPKSITLYLLLTFGLSLTLALAPPVAWDSLSYHLRGPQLYLQAGRIYPGIDVFSLNNPFLLEMLFMLGMALRSDAVAQLIHFLFAILLAMAVYRIAVRFVKVRQGWTAVLLLLSTPMVMQLAAWPYNDLALAFFTLMAFAAYFHWRETGNGRWLILSGLFAGLTMSLKYTSFLVPLFLALAAAWQLRKPQAILRAWLQFALPALAISIIWYIKNWVFTGNPVYPFVFGGALWSDFRTLTHSDPGSGLGWNVLNLLRIPYDLTLGIRDISGDGPIGPMYLAFLPLLLFYLFGRRFRRAPEAVRLLLAFFGLEMVFWTLGVINSRNLYQARLLLPALAALCLVMAWVWADLRQWDHPQFSLHDFLRLVLAAVLLLGLAAQFGAWWRANPLPYVAGTQSREAYWRSQLGALAAASLEMGEYVPETAVIQFFYEPRTYLCGELACRGDHILDKYAVLEHEYHQADAMAAALAEEGVTHILLFQAGLEFLQNDDVHWILPVDTAVYNDFFNDHTRLVHNWHDAYLLYELVP